MQCWVAAANTHARVAVCVVEPACGAQDSPHTRIHAHFDALLHPCAMLSIPIAIIVSWVGVRTTGCYGQKTGGGLTPLPPSGIAKTLLRIVRRQLWNLASTATSLVACN